MDKALEYEKAVSSSSKDSTSSFDFIKLPRARSVHQRWLSTPISTLFALLISIYYLVLRPALFAWGKASRHDAIIMNGPGTCVPLVAAVYILRFLGLTSPRLIYVESFARVESLSLTAKILRRFVDVFLVQWEQGKALGADYQGILV